MNDGVEVVYVTREELLKRRAVVEAELAQIRSLRTERQCLNELDQIAFLLGTDPVAGGARSGGHLNIPAEELARPPERTHETPD